ncbi:MAG TPA: RDD family protein [Flavilitoribacter sp.]|nr:RDD family protein [Flavilitoribacter sp.]
MDHSSTILDYEPTQQNPEFFLAGTGARLVNFILDRIGAYVFMFICISVLDAVGLSDDDVSVLALLIFLFSFFGYWILFEYLFGKTPAKFITRTKVVTKYGTKPEFLTIVGRTLCRFIPFEPFSFLGSKPVGWHDSITNTRVVSDKYVLEDDKFV